MTREGIVKIVVQQIAQALEKQESEIAIEASLTRNLGAESIDLIDLTFRLEKAFKITIPEGDLFDPQPGPNSSPLDQVSMIIEYIEKRLKS